MSIHTLTVLVQSSSGVYRLPPPPPATHALTSGIYLLFTAPPCCQFISLDPTSWPAPTCPYVSRMELLLCSDIPVLTPWEAVWQQEFFLTLQQTTARELAPFFDPLVYKQDSSSKGCTLHIAVGCHITQISTCFLIFFNIYTRLLGELVRIHRLRC